MSRGIRGLVGQSMGGPSKPRPSLPDYVSATANTTFTARYTGVALVYAYGSGGSGGQQDGGGGVLPGWGGAAAYGRFRMQRGQVMTLTPGAGGAGVTGGGSGLPGLPGGDTIVSAPDGRRMVAGGGSGGNQPGARAGVATGGEVNVDGSGTSGAFLSVVTPGIIDNGGTGSAANTTPGGTSAAGVAGHVLLFFVREG